VETEKDCSSCSPISGGGSKRMKSRDELISARPKSNLLINKLYKSTSSEKILSNKKAKD
jgi:hypothetical protein